MPRPDSAADQREPAAPPVAVTKPAPTAAPVTQPAPAAFTATSTTFAPEQSPRRGVAAWIPAAVLGVAVIVLLVVVVVATHGVYWAKPNDSASARTVRQEQVLAAVKKCFAQINTYDYRKLDGLTQRDLACSTGTFTNDLRRALQTQILPRAPKVKATQTAQINKAGIASVSPSGDQVVILIYGQLAQSNTQTAKASPRVDVVGAVVTADLVHGTWLISKVDSDTGS